jgi:hypothetical protein
VEQNDDDDDVLPPPPPPPKLSTQRGPSSVIPSALAANVVADDDDDVPPPPPPQKAKSTSVPSQNSPTASGSGSDRSPVPPIEEATSARAAVAGLYRRVSLKTKSQPALRRAVSVDTSRFAGMDADEKR